MSFFFGEIEKNFNGFGKYFCFILIVSRMEFVLLLSGINVRCWGYVSVLVYRKFIVCE